jgi:hypothetical protein
MSTDYTILACKSGVVTTDANGLAQVVFTNGFQNPTNYSVLLTCLDNATAITAYPSNLTNTGFEISSYIINRPTGTGQIPCVLTAQAGVIVYWLAVINSNI